MLWPPSVMIAVIDAGRRTATYKLALLLALIDLCAKETDSEGRGPEVVYTREIAQHVAALYWPQVAPLWSCRARRPSC
jgi:hypothetical protein